MVKRLLVVGAPGRNLIVRMHKGEIDVAHADSARPRPSHLVLEAPSALAHERGAGAPPAKPGTAKSPWPWPDVHPTFVAGLPPGATFRRLKAQGALTAPLTADRIGEILSEMSDDETRVVMLGGDHGQ